ncbi:RsmB/NOP family class I SAM-dependent RNA methyltransferase, partial [bacterium]|nr:RsmB/NOP family class I SAM-dependent RNA methyltransferase [bacterium]
ARERDTTKRAAGLVNAVLRRLSEGYPKPPDMERDPVGYLAVTGSHPRWLIARWLERFGFEETERLCNRNNEPPDSFVFGNTQRGASRKDITGLNLDGEPVPDFPGCFKLSRGTDLASTEEYKRGLVYAADPATALAALVLKPQPGELILDACSAPGGKLFHLHRLAGGGLETVAVDSSPRRCCVLVENVSRLGIPTAVIVGDLLLAPLKRGRFDKILLDAPCSNTGVLRRRVEARWRRKPHDLKKLARLQLDLLGSVSRLVKSGGLLAYSTCSLEPEENEGVVNSFLKRRGDLDRVPIRGRLDDELWERFGDREGYIRALPHRTNTDGVFVTLLRKVR